MVIPSHRRQRSTSAAISAVVGLLEGCSINTGSRILVFTSGPDSEKGDDSCEEMGQKQLTRNHQWVRSRSSGFSRG
ncbi:unnamed protein product [Camellia sinensis]